MPFPRKNIRLPPDRYTGKNIYFITICCHDRRPVLRDAGVVPEILATLRDLCSRQEFAVHAYCFMPDHLHLLCEGLSDRSHLVDFLGRFKQRTAFEYRSTANGRLWQDRYYDHILRRADAIEDVAWYIWMNPVRKGLCSGPREFAFSGSFTLPWNQTVPPAHHWQPPWKQKNAGLKPGAT